MAMPSSPWFPKPMTSQRGQLKLFCFPYAGGTSQIYRGWDEYLPPAVELVPVELPGRNLRLRDPAFVSLPVLVQALTTEISPMADEPFAFFGHSLGAIVAFELARNMRRVLNREPEVLCVSGRRAPQIPSNKPTTYDLPRDEFIAELRRIDGTPSEVLEHQELMELMIPLLRADFELIETYKYDEGAPLGCPIAAYAGRSDDEATEELMSGWRSQTASGFSLEVVPGDHFFLRASQTRLLRLLSQRLKECLAHGRIASRVTAEAAT